MSELYVVGFDDELTADKVLTELSKHKAGSRGNLEYAAVLIRKEDGQIMIRHTYPLDFSHTFHGSFWGLLIGTLLLNPIAGIVSGGVAGTMVGTLKHLGVDDNFIKSLGEKAQPGTSMLFVIEREATPGTVLHELIKYHGKILRTSFSFANEEKLRNALNEINLQES